MKKQGTAIVPCKCEHKQQDRMYGVGRRVANTTARHAPDFVEVRCTVCSTVHRARPEQVR